MRNRGNDACRNSARALFRKVHGNKLALLRGRGNDIIGPTHADFDGRGPVSSLTPREFSCARHVLNRTQMQSTLKHYPLSRKRHASRGRSALTKHSLLQPAGVRQDPRDGWGCRTVSSRTSRARCPGWLGPACSLRLNSGDILHE